MTSNEKEFLEAIGYHLQHVKEAQDYIKENLGLDSVYDEDAVELHIKANTIAESTQMAAAKQYINENLDCVDVVYDYE